MKKILTIICLIMSSLSLSLEAVGYQRLNESNNHMVRNTTKSVGDRIIVQIQDGEGVSGGVSQFGEGVVQALNSDGGAIVFLDSSNEGEPKFILLSEMELRLSAVVCTTLDKSPGCLENREALERENIVGTTNEAAEKVSIIPTNGMNIDYRN